MGDDPLYKDIWCDPSWQASQNSTTQTLFDNEPCVVRHCWTGLLNSLSYLKTTERNSAVYIHDRDASICHIPLFSHDVPCTYDDPIIMRISKSESSSRLSISPFFRLWARCAHSCLSYIHSLSLYTLITHFFRCLPLFVHIFALNPPPAPVFPDFNVYNTTRLPLPLFLLILPFRLWRTLMDLCLWRWCSFLCPILLNLPLPISTRPDLAYAVVIRLSQWASAPHQFHANALKRLYTPVFERHCFCQTGFGCIGTDEICSGEKGPVKVLVT